jgi:hypothetical protein
VRRPHEPLTSRLRDIAAAHARHRGDALRLPALHPVRVALAVEAAGGTTRERLIARGVSANAFAV